MDPAKANPGKPLRELDIAHPGSDTQQVSRVEPGNEVVDPDATMVKLEQEHQDRESELLAQISDLDNRARSYEERLDELASTNTNLLKALRNLESGVKARVDAIQR
jgi:uncharacterized protein YlxW (UPF0749 family)